MRFLTIFWAILLCLALFYFFQIKPLIIGFFEDRSPAWFSEAVAWVYPRLAVERSRFDSIFFISKADQIVWRTLFLVALFSVFCLFFLKKNAFQEKLNAFWNLRIPERRIRYFTVLFFGLSLFEAWSWHENLEAMQNYLFFYEPVWFLKILSVPFPNLFVINTLYFIFSFACLFCIFNFRPFLSGLVAVLIFVFFQALHQGFAKTDHAYSTWLYAGLFMPFLLWESQKPDAQNKVAAWAWQLIRIAICTAYWQAGLEKLWVSGGSWASADTFRAYLLMFNTPLGIWVSASDWLCRLLPLGTLFFQLFFCSILFFKPLQYFFLPLGVLFHVGVYLLFGIGGYVTFWYVVYLFFINWEAVERKIQMYFYICVLKKICKILVGTRKQKIK